MDFVQIWLSGLLSPSQAFKELKNKPAPLWGLWSVFVRFAGTSLTTILALYLLRREPFTPSSLTFLTTKNYYIVEIFFLPIFGLMVWLLMSAIAHIVLRLIEKVNEFDKVLNIVGLSMLIPMPVIWLWDWTMIALNSYQLVEMAISHVIFQLWETYLGYIGFKTILMLRTSVATILALAINGVFILLAMIFIR